MSKHFLYHLPTRTKFNFNHPHCHKVGEHKGAGRKTKARRCQMTAWISNDFNHNNTSGNSLYDIQEMSICILFTKGMLPLVPIQHDTPRHCTHGYFRRSCKLGFGAKPCGQHFASVAVHPSQLRITGYPRTYDMHIIKLCCCRQLQIDWQNIILCNLDREHN